MGLIGTGLYYNAKTGRRTNDMDADVTPEAVERSTKLYPSLIGEWSCRNGDPRDVRYFRDGKQIEESALPTSMR